MAKVIEDSTENILFALGIVQLELMRIKRTKENCLKYADNPYPSNVLTIQDFRCWGQINNALGDLLDTYKDAEITPDTVKNYAKKRALLFKVKEQADQLMEQQRMRDVEATHGRFKEPKTEKERSEAINGNASTEKLPEENNGKIGKSIGETVPFGRYDGRPIDVMLEDKGYCMWLNDQDWYREKYDYLYDLTKNTDDEPNE